MATLRIPRLNTTKQSIHFPSKVNIAPQALFQVVSQALYRQDDQERVIGVLVGNRGEDGNRIHVKGAYVIPVTETEDEVKIGLDYYNQTIQQLRMIYPSYGVVGWYATSSTLNNLSALIHTFFQENGTSPYPAVHLTLQTTEAADLDIRTYITSPVGIPESNNPQALSVGSCVFLPIENTVEYTLAEKCAMRSVQEASQNESRTAYLSRNIENVDQTLDELSRKLVLVEAYVNGVLEGKVQPNEEIGRSLYRALEVRDLANDRSPVYKSHMKDIIALNNLSESLKTQINLSRDLTGLV